MASRLLIIPLELRLEIYGRVMGHACNGSELPCCYQYQLLRNDHIRYAAWLYDFDELENFPHGAYDMANLGRVNKQLSGEVQKAFFSKVNVKICMHATRPTTERKLNCLGLSFSAYDDFFADAECLNYWLQNFANVEFTMQKTGSTNEEDTSHALLNEHFLLLDDCRMLADALEKSRSVKKFRISFTCHAVPMGQDTNFDELFGAFEKLPPRIKIEFRLRYKDKDWQEIKKVTPYGGFPTQKHIEYIEHLENRRTERDFKLPRSLIDEWIHLRSWLHSILPQLDPRAEDVVAEDLNTRLRMRYDQIKPAAAAELRRIIIRAWGADNKADSDAFQIAKQDLLQWWQARCIEKGNLMVDGVRSGGPVAEGDGWDRL